MGRIIKELLKIMLIVVIILFLLDFIPIKMAVKDYEKYRENVRNKEQSILVGEEDYPCISWLADTENNPYNAKDIWFVLYNIDPYTLLSGDELNSNRFPERNYFLFIGDMKNIQSIENTDKLKADFYADKWEIMYPIERHTIRKYYVPKSYLTIYDFDFKNLLKYLLEKLKQEEIA